MKKLFLVTAVVLVTLFLSGCDLISPQQIEEISEEYCRENPTAEICQGDVVGDLEDDVILNVFNTILDEYNDDTNTTFCDDYFSVTNTELLDACRESRSDLVPEDYVGFTVSSVVKQTTLSTQDVYEITVISEDLLTEIVFTVGLVFVDGIMYINSWSYDEGTVDPVDLEVPLDEARDYFEQFIQDYLNPDITSFNICNNYFQDDVTGCIEDRENSFNVGFGISLESMTDLGDGVFNIEMEFTDDEMTEPKANFEDVSFKYDEEMNIIMEFIRIDDSWKNALDAYPLIVMFFEDYMDDAMTNEQINDKYFDNNMDDEFLDERASSNLEGATFAVVSVEEPTMEPFDYLVMTATRTHEGEVESIVVSIRIKQIDNDKYYLEILMEDGEAFVDATDAFALLEEFFADYANPELSSDDLNNKWFDGTMNYDFLDERDEQILRGMSFDLFTLVETEGDPYDFLIATFEVSILDEEPETQSVFLRFHDIGDDRYYLEILFDYMPGFEYDTLRDFVDRLFEDYMNPDLSDEYVCNLYLDPEMAEGCMEDRAEGIGDGASIELLDMFMYDGTYELIMQFSDGVNTEMQNEYVEFYYDQDGNLKIYFLDSKPSNIQYEDAYWMVEDFFYRYRNNSMTNFDVCSIYLEGYSYDNCVFGREMDLANDNTLNGFDLYEEDEGYRLLFYFVDNMGNPYTKDMKVYFYYNEWDEIKMDIQEDLHLIPYEEAEQFMINLVNDYNSFDLSSSDVCYMYFQGEFAEGCIEKREQDIADDVHLNLYNFWQEYDHYRVEFEYFDADGNTWYEGLNAFFWYDEFNNLFVEFHGDENDQFPYDEAYNYIQNMLYDFSNDEISDADFCYMYFPYMDSTNCIFDRAILPLEHMDVWLEYMNYYDNIFEAVIVFNNNYNGDNWTQQVYLEFWWDEYNNIQVNFHWNPVQYYLNYGDAYGVIQNYVFDYMNPDISFDQINATYFDYRLDYQFEQDRNETFEIGRYYSLLDIHDPYGADGQDWLEVILEYYEEGDSYPMTVWMKVIPLDNGFHLIEIKEEQHINDVILNYDEALGFIEMFLGEYLDYAIPSYDVCSRYFDAYEYPMCMVKRDQQIADAIFVELGMFEQYDDGFYADFLYYNEIGEFIFSEYTHVKFFIDEVGELRLSFNTNNYQLFFPYDEAYMYIENMFYDAYNPEYPTEEFCGMYERIIPNCHEVKETIFNGEGNLFIGNFWHQYDNVFYLEFGYEGFEGDVQFYSMELAFYYDDFGNIVVDTWNIGPDFYFMDFVDASNFYEQFLGDYMNPDIGTEEIIWMYFNGMMDDNFRNRRAEDLASISNITILGFDDPTGGNGLDWLNVDLEITRFGAMEYETNHFRGIVYPDYSILEFEQYVPKEISYADAYDLFFNYINSLNDMTLNDEEVCTGNVIGWMFDECMMIREDGINVDFIDFYFDEYNRMYGATIAWIYQDNSEPEYKEYDLWFWYEEDQVFFEMWEKEIWDPQYDQVWNMFWTYTEEFVDPTINSIDFCNHYSPSDPGCTLLRDQVLPLIEYSDFTEFWPADGYEVWFYEARFGLVLTDGTNMEVNIHIYPYFDEYNELYIEVYIRSTNTHGAIDGTLLGYEETMALLTQFANDYSNPLVTPEQFCTMYFGGFYGGTECLEGRQEFLAQMGTATFLEMEELIDINDEVVYLAHFEMIVMGDTHIQEGAFRIYMVDVGMYFVEFVDDYLLPIDPLVLEGASYDEAIDFYIAFLTDYPDLSISDEQMCAMYFNNYDSDFNCLEGRTEFVEAGGHSVLFGFDEVLIVDEISYFNVTLNQRLTSEGDFNLFTQSYYFYKTPDGMFMQLILIEE